jgi:hypothetical protein
MRKAGASSSPVFLMSKVEISGAEPPKIAGETAKTTLAPRDLTS